MFFSSKAQIVYTDVVPDSTISLTNNSYYLDLNNDETVDFSFMVDLGTTRCGETGFGNWGSADVNPVNGSKIVKAGGYPRALEVSEIIDSSLIWSGSVEQTLRYVKFGPFCSSSYGNWDNPNDHYLGLRILADSNVYYGWVRLSVSVSAFSSSVTIRDYACNYAPSQPILAGQTCPPLASIIANGPTTFCLGDSVLLSSANTGTNLSYKWKLNGVNITGATYESYTAKVAGKYKVRVTDNTNGCASTSAVVKVKVPCKVIDDNLVAEDDALKVYPNPISTSCVISFAIFQSSNVSLKIFDLQGRLIRTLADESMNSGTHSFTWNAQDENGNETDEGIYLLQLKTEHEQKVVRISLIK